MFGIGMPELLVILAVALIVIGPKKLPELAKTLGKAMGEFKRATSDLKQNFEKETGLDEVGKDLRNINREMSNSFKGAGKFSSAKQAKDDDDDEAVKTPPLLDQAPSSSDETPATQKDTPEPSDSSEPKPSEKTDPS